MSSGVKEESISRQLFEDQEDLQYNNNNLSMQSEDQQNDGGGDMNNDDASHKNDNNTSTANQCNEQQPMESQQNDGLYTDELTSTLMGGDNNMNQEEKAKRYDWLLDQYKGIEMQIRRIPKLPMEETLQDLQSREYSPENQAKVNYLKNQLTLIDAEVKRLF